jgi:hypothetical protein
MGFIGGAEPVLVWAAEILRCAENDKRYEMTMGFQGFLMEQDNPTWVDLSADGHR